MPPRKTIHQRGPDNVDDSDDWDSESDGDKSENDEGIKIHSLLPVSTSLGKPNDRLCDVCSKLNLTPRRFVVLPSDRERASKADYTNIRFGLVGDIKRKSHCPLCRLVLTSFGRTVPSIQDDEPISVTMSWNTDGPIPDITMPWHHIPKIRVLRPYLQKPDGSIIHVKGLNSLPEITLLANDAPTPSKTFFVRVIKDQIDFGMVENWLSMCRIWHGSQCNKSPILEYQLKDPKLEIPYFRLIDVVNNCIIQVPASKDCTYVALSYVWGRIDPTSCLRLTKDNVAQLEIPGALIMPKNYNKIFMTVRDAMQVVRDLHMRYLWVDCLCIIHDDVENFVAAISTMDRVHAKAYLTIFAATGDNGNDGLPGVRPGTRNTTQPIEEISPGLRLAARPRYQDYKDTVYFTRGWLFQEQQLAKRSLLFIGGQVVYRCMRTDQWREDVVVEHRHSKYGRVALQDRDPNDMKQYEDLIGAYSGLSHTYHRDVYNAFAPMAGYFKAELKVNLCHGIPDAYFDWFLLWTPLVPQRRRDLVPSWSWSGWIGESRTNISEWHTNNIKRIRKALRQRTWIIWYQRVAHDSVECIRVWTPHKRPLTSSLRNFYGSHIQSRFSFDCSQTYPTLRKLVNAPTYIKDTHNPNPGSGFLQFWTVCIKFRLHKTDSKNDTGGLINASWVGIFGRGGRELGVVCVNPEWSEMNVPKVHDFILLCEGRDEPAQDGRIDDEKGWKYKMMLIEWHGDWAERVSLTSLEMIDLDEALGMGPVWREIILG